MTFIIVPVAVFAMAWLISGSVRASLLAAALVEVGLAAAFAWAYWTVEHAFRCAA